VPSPPCGARTPSTRGTTPVQWKTSSCDESSSKTWVKQNFSMARRRSLGGFNVTCVGARDRASDAGGSTAKKRSAAAAPAWGGRSRRKTWKRLCVLELDAPELDSMLRGESSSLMLKRWSSTDNLERVGRVFFCPVVQIVWLRL